MLNQPLKPMLLQPTILPDKIKNWRSSIKWEGLRNIIHYHTGKFIFDKFQPLLKEEWIRREWRRVELNPDSH